jgi:hypothetical protein
MITQLKKKAKTIELPRPLREHSERFATEEREFVERRIDCAETLVPDERGCVGPAQQVENKLRAILKVAPVRVSHLRTASRCFSRHQP